jgi:predicted kinase
MLVQVCGLPGAGKSTLAAAIADATPAVLLRVDAVEGPMLAYGMPPERAGMAAYSILHAIAGPHLARGQLVIADAVSPVRAAREGWVATAAALGSGLRVIEVVCPDVAERRRRVEHRPNDIPNFTLPTWEWVKRMSADYEPRTDDRLVVDSTRDLADTVRDALDFIFDRSL